MAALLPVSPLRLAYDNLNPNPNPNPKPNIDVNTKSQPRNVLDPLLFYYTNLESLINVLDPLLFYYTWWMFRT